MKSKKNKNSLAIAVYFGFFIGIIILISFVFKGIDIVRNSKFDSNHRLSVVVHGENATQVISVSPKDGTIFRLNIKGRIDGAELKGLSVPVDAYINLEDDRIINGVSPKSEFSKFFLNGKARTDLTFIDLIRLIIFSGGINSENIDEENVGAKDTSKINEISSSFFKDPVISSEKINIQITNTTSSSGLGNKLAKYITNLGGVVILVNSSSTKTDNSKIVAMENSETVKRLSKVLGIPIEKGQGSEISDVIIIIGEDKVDLFN